MRHIIATLLLTACVGAQDTTAGAQDGGQRVPQVVAEAYTCTSSDQANGAHALVLPADSLMWSAYQCAGDECVYRAVTYRMQGSQISAMLGCDSMQQWEVHYVVP